MKQELNNSQNSTNTETNPLKKSESIITKKSNQELLTENDLNTIESNLVEGRTLSEIISDKKINPQQISLMKFYAFLKKNPQIETRILEARKLGVQTLIDKLLQIFSYQEIENPNAILWIREKSKFVQWVAAKITDLYSDNKPIKQNIDSKISISWEDNSNNLIDVSGDTIDVPPETKD